MTCERVALKIYGGRRGLINKCLKYWLSLLIKIKPLLSY